jgi:hypothetical protein
MPGAPSPNGRFVSKSSSNCSCLTGQGCCGVGDIFSTSLESLQSFQHSPIVVFIETGSLQSCSSHPCLEDSVQRSMFVQKSEFIGEKMQQFSIQSNKLVNVARAKVLDSSVCSRLDTDRSDFGLVRSNQVLEGSYFLLGSGKSHIQERRSILG